MCTAGVDHFTGVSLAIRSSGCCTARYCGDQSVARGRHCYAGLATRKAVLGISLVVSDIGVVRI